MLVLCTGNICRSPMAEALLRQYLHDAGADARVSSAGLLMDGEPASEHALTVLAGRGLDLRSHRSRRIAHDVLDPADLVIGMARRHVQEAAVTHPAAWPKSFTLKEIVRRAEERGGRTPGEPFDEWLAKIHAGRRTQDLLGHAEADDIADPYGRPRAAYEATVGELDDLCRRLVALAFPREDPSR